MALLEDLGEKEKGLQKGKAFPGTFWGKFTLVGILIFSLLVTRALGVKESDLKAAFLYQFTKFVEWPDDNGTGKELIIGVMADDEVLKAIKLLDGKESQKRQIRIKKISKFPDGGRLNVLFVQGCCANDIDNVVETAIKAHILTVCDQRDGIDKGFIISLFNEGSRLRFNINLKVAQKSSIRLSSRLLRLAKKVIN